MKVFIKEQEYDYQSDYSAGWKFSALDHFKFPVRIGRYDCFIKRFEKKSPKDISGWQLLTELRADHEPGLPRLHDIIRERESKRDIYYIFYECLEGDTLYDHVRDNETVDLERLVKDLFQAMASIHRHRHWFPDVCEKNIFCTRNEGYFMIDLDSSYPILVAPENDMHGDKLDWGLSLNFLADLPGYAHIKPVDVSGVLLNYLQLVFLILRIRIGMTVKRDGHDPDVYFKGIRRCLDRLVPEFRESFARLLKTETQEPDEAETKQIRALVLERIVRGEPGPVWDLCLEENSEASLSERVEVISGGGIGMTSGERGRVIAGDRHAEKQGGMNESGDRHSGKNGGSDVAKGKDRHGKKDWSSVIGPGMKKLLWGILAVLLIVWGVWIFLHNRNIPVNALQHPVTDSNAVKARADSLEKARKRDSMELARIADSARTADSLRRKDMALRAWKRDSAEKAIKEGIARDHEQKKNNPVEHYPDPPAKELPPEVEKEEGPRGFEMTRQEQKIVDSMRIFSQNYNLAPLGLTHRKRLMLVNGSSFLLERVAIEITVPGNLPGHSDKIVIMKYVRPHTQTMVLDGLLRNDRTKAIVRAVHLLK
ncbi:MAG TPA: hypothetical protein VE035_08625 [Puia sp.]|nr:hypothetical protein [Puia sp.]